MMFHLNVQDNNGDV